MSGNPLLTGGSAAWTESGPAVQSISTVGSTLTNASSVQYTVTFNESVTNVLPADFVLAGYPPAGGGAAGTIASVSGSGSTYTVTVNSVSGNGTLGLNLVDDNSIVNAYNNPLGGLAPGDGTFTDQLYTIDTVAPTISIGSPSVAFATSRPVTYTVTYADAYFNASTLTPGNVTLNATGTAGGTLAVSGTGLTRTVTISGISGNGSLGISIAAGTALDLAGNLAPAAGPSTTFIVDDSPPTAAAPASATPDHVTGTTTALATLGADSVFGEGGLTYSWAATTMPPGAAAPTFSVNASNAAKNSTATFSRAGTYVFTVTIANQGGLTVTSAVSVTVAQTLTSIVVTPASVTLGLGAVQQFAATAYDQFGNALATQPAFTWTTTVGTINSTGLLAAPKTAASGIVTAASGGMTSAGEDAVVTCVTTDSLGVYSGGYWYIDVNGTTRIVGVPSAWAGATPVTGDWNGAGKTEIGLFNNATATWWLDTAGNEIFNSSETFTFGFGGSGVFPVVGDWNGAGKTEVGVYSNGAWFRDVDGSHTWDAANQATLAYLGWNGAPSGSGTNTVIPVPGEWAGDGKTEMGVYCQGVWFLDSTGSGQWDGGHAYWGWAGSLIPVVGNWSGSGAKSQFGVYNQGAWFLDYDNSHLWDAANQAALTYYGWAGAQPVVGVWGSGFQAAAGETASSVQSPMLGAAQIQPAVGAAIAGGTGSLGPAASNQPGGDSGLANGIEVQAAAAVKSIASTAVDMPPPALDPQAVDRIDLSTVTGGQVAGLPDLNASLDLLASNQFGMGVRRLA